MPPLASLDVGSNTVRLLIAEAGPGLTFRPLRRERVITRLGGNFSAENGLHEASVQRSVDALRSFADLLAKEGVERCFAAGTGVLREARNSRAFVKRVLQDTGLDLRLLTGEEEARLTLRGVLSSLADRYSPCLITDVGGWSTEVIWVEDREPLKTASLGLGAVALTEKWLVQDPPSKGNLAKLRSEVRRVLQKTRRDWEKEGRRVGELHPHLVATAGTATTLAAMDLCLSEYDPQKINGHRIARGALKRICLRLPSLPLEDRRRIPGLERGREDLIVAGAAVLLALLEVFELSALEVIDSGLLEGILLEGMGKSVEQGARSRE